MRRGASGIDDSFRTLFGLGTLGGWEDADLLELFVERSGAEAELAFSVLVERHGPMVLATCRGVLGDGPDAEDAFQATFLVLARRAGSIGARRSVAAWLHGVARRVARKAKRQAARRHAREQRAAEGRAIVHWDRQPDDLNIVLREELDRLPQKYRAPIILCYLEGLTHDEAAQRLGWPVGTVRGRMARARELLRVRLTRRGLAPATGAIATALSARRALAAPPRSLIVTTVRAATSFAAGSVHRAGVVPARVATLSEGVLTAMTWQTVGQSLFVAIPTTALVLGLSGVSARQGNDAPGPTRGGEPSQVAEGPIPKQETEPRSTEAAPTEPEADGNPHVRPVPIIGQELLEKLSSYPILKDKDFDESQLVDPRGLYNGLVEMHEAHHFQINDMIIELQRRRSGISKLIPGYVAIFEWLQTRGDALRDAISDSESAMEEKDLVGEPPSTDAVQIRRIEATYLDAYDKHIPHLGSLIRTLAARDEELQLHVRRLQMLKEAMTTPLDEAGDMSSHINIPSQSDKDEVLDANLRRSSSDAAPIDPRDRRLDELERKVDAILEALRQQADR